MMRTCERHTLKMLSFTSGDGQWLVLARWQIVGCKVKKGEKVNEEPK
jgi:hypothetical protein